MTRSTEAIRAALERAGVLAGARGDIPSTVEGITDDSRAVMPGAMFVAVRGTTRDGHEYLPAAERGGAAMAIVEDPARTSLPALVVRDSRRAAALAAAAFYGEPARALRLLAVTGTNGKTTTVSILRHLFDEPSAPAASVGTLGVLAGSAGTPVPGGSGLTTPGPIELQRVLRVLADAGVRTVAMEVSSHSLDQRRIEGVEFAAAVFTNVTRDHLDYHGTMEVYVAAKARLVEYLDATGTAVVNADDPAWSVLAPAPRSVRFSLTPDAPVHVRALGATFTPLGSEWTLATATERAPVHLPLIGGFNVANGLGAAAAAWALGMPIPETAARLSTVPQVLGRLERIAEEPTVLRDYAHTPDALERALAAVRPFVRGRLIVVFGAGGDRDRGKRPAMGAVAARGADHVIVTSDNPRTEDPEAIIDEIVAGMRGSAHERIEDRRAAIAHALEIAAPGDVVLLAGKGHETYQVRGTVSYPFDEREVVRELLLAGRDA